MAIFSQSLTFFLLMALFFGTTFEAEVTDDQQWCQCSLYTNDELPCQNTTCHTVECYFIDTAEELKCVAEYLNNVSSNSPYFPLNLGLLDSDFDVFPDDFLLPYNLLALVLNSNTMTEVPYRLINPVCPGLLELTVFYGNISTVPARGFQNCSALLKLDLSTNGITNISQEAFVGLTRLHELVVFNNNLQKFDGYQGIGTLATLDLSLNKISSVYTYAFQGLTELESINLSRNNISTLEEGTFEPLVNSPVNVNLQGNPLNCNCSLKWLQEWTVANDEDKSATCTSSQQGYLIDAGFTSCSSGTNRHNKIMTENLVSGSLLLFALSWLIC